MYQSRCPLCGGQLYLASCQIGNVHGVPIEPDGFCLTDAKHLETSAETVYCESCEYTGPLEVIERGNTEVRE